MTDCPIAPTTLGPGRFKVVTPKEAVAGAYQDDREIAIICDTGSAQQEFRAVFRLSDLRGYRGHTTSPEGFSLLYSQDESGQAWIEISRR